MALPGRTVDLDGIAGTVWEHLRQGPVAAVLAGSALAVAVAVLAVGWLTQPDSLSRGFAPVQPIPFSHRVHAGSMAMPCLFCHSGAARSRSAGIPDAEVCMGCHRVTKTDSPAIIKLKEASDAGKPIAWKRVHSLPDHVFFDHRPHVNSGVACQTCHGPIQTMATVRQHMSLRMSNCLGCHRDPGGSLPSQEPPGRSASGLDRAPILKGPENCNACHR